MLSTDENYENLSIKQIIAEDIKKYSEEKKIPLREVIKDISNKTEVGLKTLERIVDDTIKTRPYARTAADIYTYLYEADSLTEVITKAPKTISEYIEKNHNNTTRSQSISDFTKNPATQNELTKDNIFNQILLMTGGDYGTDLTTIRKKYGVNGLKRLDEMLKNGFVKIDEDEKVTRAKKLAYNSTIRRNVARTIVSEIYNAEEPDLYPEQYLGVFSGDVTPEDGAIIRAEFARVFRSSMERIIKSRPTEKEAIRLNLASVIASMVTKDEGDFIC